jgi:serine/threonine protein phosphatase PrpC
VTDRSGGPPGPTEDEPRIEVGLATDVGQVRTGNEDSIICEPLESALVAERGLFCAVADGMGGHAAGEDASSMAVQIARDVFYATNDLDSKEALRLAIAQANSAVYEAGAGTSGRDHMGTTLTAAVLSNRRAVIGHVGDSRCYLVDDLGIRQLTNDHSWVAEEVAAGRMTQEQARLNPRRNIITRALGLRADVEVEAYETPMGPGSTLVICSDGLHGLVSDDEIVSHIRRYRPADAVDALVQLANSRGGPDNISVVVARVLGADQDEAETDRGFPVLTEEMIATARADLSELQADVSTQPETPVDRSTAGLPDRPVGAIAEPSAAEDAPTPRPAPPEQMLAPAPRAQPPARRGGRSGGVALLVILVLLLALGGAIGFLMFRLAGLAG